MADTPFRHHAGNEKKLGIVRYGRDDMNQHERIANANIYPGHALMTSTDANGDPAFDLHDGSTDKAVYVAIEARGRGMDAQTDTGYESGEDVVIAKRFSGGGLNLRLDAGQTVTDGDELAVSSTTAGEFVGSGHADASNVTVGEVDEDLDLSGASDPALVAAKVE